MRWQSFTTILMVAVASGAGHRAAADDPSTDATTGIHSQGLGLNGGGIGIGQVELARPGVPGFDNAANSHPNVVPTAVFNIAGAPTANAAGELNTHAEQVAGVMISTHGTHKGVAPGALLYSSADTGPDQNSSALATEHVARQNGGDIRAINLSFGVAAGGTPLDGSSLYTRFVDWSARNHDTLYVVAGNEGAGGIPIPTDNFNGMTIAYSRTVGGTFRQVNPGNNFTEDAVGARRSTDLIAPGTSITMPTPGGGHAAASGTSFAAPHVTGTVALLQELADGKIAGGQPRWDASARTHQVMKAVLMNSADKVKDTGDGKLLSMEKTIIDTAGSNWLASDAFTSKAIPLDDEMGAGQLNASRAKTQFQTGEWDSAGSADVPLIGWDRGVTVAAGDMNKYVLDKELLKDSYISITVAWDREIGLNDFGTDGTAGTSDPGENNGFFDSGESFADLGMTNLDLYLMPKGETDLSKHVWASTSTVDSIEHIFFKIPETGEYEFWVRQADAPLGDQFYGVAWWAVPEPATAALLALAGLLGQGRGRRREGP